MSAETLAWAIRCKVAKASLKSLLMVVADLANHVSGEVFGSLAYYQEASGLGKKTVLDCLRELTALGVLEETEERRGRTGQIPVYRFNMVASIPLIKRPSDRTGSKMDPLKADAPKQAQICPETGSLLRAKEAQKCTTEPSIGNQEGEKTPPAPNGAAPPESDFDLFGEELVAEPPLPLERYVQNLWHALKADFPAVQDVVMLSEDRTKRIRARAAAIVAAEKRDGRVTTAEQVWDRIFANIRRSTFLTGLDPPRGDYAKPFSLDLEFLLRLKEFNRIWEREDDSGNGSGGHHNHLFDAAGRRLGPSEAAGRRSIERLLADEKRRARGGDRGSDHRGTAPRLTGGGP